MEQWAQISIRLRLVIYTRRLSLVPEPGFEQKKIKVSATDKALTWQVKKVTLKSCLGDKILCSYEFITHPLD